MQEQVEYWHDSSEMWSERAFKKAEEADALFTQVFLWKMISLASWAVIGCLVYWIAVLKLGY